MGPLSPLSRFLCLSYITPPATWCHEDCQNLNRLQGTGGKSRQGHLPRLSMGHHLAPNLESVHFPACTQTQLRPLYSAPPTSPAVSPGAALFVTGIQNQARSSGKTLKLVTCWPRLSFIAENWALDCVNVMAPYSLTSEKSLPQWPFPCSFEGSCSAIRDGKRHHQVVFLRLQYPWASRPSHLAQPQKTIWKVSHWPKMGRITFQ